MRIRFNYRPDVKTASLDQLAEAAYRCGLDLHPSDRQAAWMGEDVHRVCCESYHAGQAERYENEEW